MTSIVATLHNHSAVKHPYTDNTVNIGYNKILLIRNCLYWIFISRTQTKYINYCFWCLQTHRLLLWTHTI